MTHRLLIGNYGDGTYGMKLSMPGYSVLTAESDKMVFDSKWIGAGNIHQTGVSTIGSTVTFPNMSYIPMAIISPYSGSNAYNAYWTNNNPYSNRWSTSYETKVAEGAPYIITTNSIHFLSPPSGYTNQYTYLRYVIFKLPGV